MTFETIFTPANVTLGILIIASVFFMRGKVRSDIVALCALLALLLFDILTPSQALAGFSNSVVIMMVGLFVVGAGIFRTGLAKMISSRIISVGGKNQNLLFILVMLVTALIGAFVSNTGTVAVMMPIVLSMTASAGIDARRYLMPMAFASSMGLFTLISTPPNLVIQDVLVEAGREPLGFFSFAPVGAITVTIGVLLLFFMSKLLIKKGDSGAKKKRKQKTLNELVEDYNLSRQTFRVEVPAGSPIVGKSLKELGVGADYDVRIGKIIHLSRKRFRRGTVEEMAGPDSVIAAGDVLFSHGIRENIENFVKDKGLAIDSFEEGEVDNSGDLGVAELFIMPNSQLINHTISDSRFRELYNVNVLGIKRQEEYDINDIRDLKLHSGDALLIQGIWDNIMVLDTYPDEFVLVGQPEKEAAKVTLDRKAPVAGAIMIAMIAVMVLNIIPAVAAVLGAAVLMVVTGCLRNMEEAYSSINWSSVVLIAAMIPMSTAFEVTGITGAIADFLGQFENMSPYMLLAIIYFSTSLLTMFLSNTATAVLFAPIGMNAAIAAGYDPKAFLFAVAVAASMCFASPFSTPPDALVMSAGGYKFGDYIKVGLPLQIVMGVVMVFMLPFIFPF